MNFALTLPSRFDEAVREGSSSFLWMTLFNPKAYTLNVSCCYLYYKRFTKGGPS